MRTMGRLGSVLRVAAMTLPLMAVVKELRTPRQHRRWHGKLAGIVPYEFRRPTWGRLRRSVWDPGSDHLLVPQAFGVGWTVNLGRLVRLLRTR